MANTTTTYTVWSQHTPTGKFLDSKTYDTLEYAQIHYDALSTLDRNSLTRVVSTKNSNTYTTIHSNY